MGGTDDGPHPKRQKTPGGRLVQLILEFCATHNDLTAFDVRERACDAACEMVKQKVSRLIAEGAEFETIIREASNMAPVEAIIGLRKVEDMEPLKMHEYIEAADVDGIAEDLMSGAPPGSYFLEVGGVNNSTTTHTVFEALRDLVPHSYLEQSEIRHHQEDYAYDLIVICPKQDTEHSD